MASWLFLLYVVYSASLETVDRILSVNRHCSFSSYRLQGRNSLFTSICSSSTALFLNKTYENEHVIYDQ